jgi:hypothetical protein
VRATSDWRSVAWIVVLCGPAIAVAWTSPALDQGRYNLFVVGTMVTIIAWMSGASRLGGLAGDGAIGAASVMAVMSYADADPRFVLLPSELRALARLPAAEREVTPELGAATIREVGIARERELGPGDVVAFGDDYGGFVAELFNNEFSNRAIYVPDSSTFLKDAEAAGAKWVFCAPTSPCFDQVKLPDSGWTSVGRLHHNDDGAVYRRVAP